MSFTYKKMYETIHLLFDFGYVLTFGILGVIVLLTRTPRQTELSSYRKARTTLGIGLTILSLFCIVRIVTRQHHEDYVSFWLLVTFTLIHSWLTYSTMLFLLETPRYLTKNFLIDGIIPASLMIFGGFIGLLFPSLQPTMFVIFGCIFGIKCLWMFYTCRREYLKCEKELENNYDQLPDIKWINGLIWISLIMSAATIVSFYVPAIHPYYYLAIPVIYTFIVVKIINFMPQKIDNIRHDNLTADKVAETPKKVNDLREKIEPKVEKWIQEKRFCQPDLNIRDVALEMGTNQNYLSQYLNGHKGVTFQLWLNTLRIEESKTILTSGERISIEEVGVRVGIPQSYNFSRWFRAITDMTPYQYRKANN